MTRYLSQDWLNPQDHWILSSQAHWGSFVGLWGIHCTNGVCYVWLKKTPQLYYCFLKYYFLKLLLKNFFFKFLFNNFLKIFFKIRVFLISFLKDIFHFFLFLLSSSYVSPYFFFFPPDSIWFLSFLSGAFA